VAVITKIQKMKRVAEVTAGLLAGHRIEQISFSQVARLSGISRAWLYLYVGKSRADLGTLTIQHFAHFLGKFEGRVEVSNFEEWRVSQIEDFSEFLDIAVELPHILAVYFKSKNSKSALGRIIRESEAKFLDISTAEVHRALHVEMPKAKWIAEYNLASKMGLVHHWLSKGRLSREEKQQLLLFFDLSLNQFNKKSSR
jgi:hypothetical protein